jgi:NADH dehydrogenase [ubiquinone] 1 alpha subcomplex assembly factor 5
MVESAPDNIHVFERQVLPQKRARVAAQFDDYDFLFKWAQAQTRDRLADITRDFPHALQIGARGGRLRDDIPTLDFSAAFKPDILADGEFLPLKQNSLDLHSVNDLPGALLQIRKALKPDGLFIASIFGGESLFELRESLMQAEMALKGGVSPRVFPFADKQQMGALLQRAGFALPVVDSEIITVTYDSMFKLMADLRGMGESNIIAARDKRNPGKALFMEAAQYYAQHFTDSSGPDKGRIRATFEIIFLLGWSPHESQQQPLKPGSAQTRLADVLDTTETSL